MELKRYADAGSFYARVGPFLLEREAEHCLPIGLCSTMIASPDFYPNPYLAAVEDNGEVIAAAVMTPPHDPVFCFTDQYESLSLFVDDLKHRYGRLGGALGPVDVVTAFIDLWRAATGQSYRIDIAERIYRLEHVIPVSGVPGQIRRATPADRDLVIRWTVAFHEEALGIVNEEQVARSVDVSLSGSQVRGLYLWEDNGQAVSLAGFTGPTPNGIRIGPVYTPPECRGRGYASACVAVMSQILLDEGRKYCFLFTDLKNATANHIYQVIGYEPVCDFNKYVFDTAV